jgi:hypothetical protein
MGKVYHIHQIKLIEAFQTFEKKQTVDKALASYLDKNGISKQKFYDFFSNLPRNEVRKYYKLVVSAFQKYIKNSAELDLQLRYDLEDVYYTVTNNLKTCDRKYIFPSVLKSYHKNINPVRALYFEIQEIDIVFDKDNPDHVFVIDKIKDRKFIELLIQDIKADIRSLQSLEKRFMETKKAFDFFSLPMTYYHTQEMIKDMKKWSAVFLDHQIKYGTKKFKYD